MRFFLIQRVHGTLILLFTAFFCISCLRRKLSKITLFVFMIIKIDIFLQLFLFSLLTKVFHTFIIYIIYYLTCARRAFHTRVTVWA